MPKITSAVLSVSAFCEMPECLWCGLTMLKPVFDEEVRCPVWLGAARARKRQVKEVKAMLDGTERNADEKLRLLNTKYLLQVCRPLLKFPVIFCKILSACIIMSRMNCHSLCP